MMRLLAWMALLLTVTLIAGCGTMTGNFCDVASPIRASAADQVTEGTKAQVVAHNLYGERACGWRAN